MHNVGDVIFTVLYLASGVGLAGPNVEVLSAVATYLKVRGSPFLIMADWNMEMEEVDQIHLSTYLDGSWMAPAGDHPGGHRLIDYCLVASSIKHMVKLEWDLQGPWASPHVGIKGALKVGGQKLMKRIMGQPTECQLAFGPDRPWQHHLE
eukprot:1142939-Pyramimonas_sp.AAC.1